MSPGGKLTKTLAVSGPASLQGAAVREGGRGKSRKLSPHLRSLQGRLCELRDISDQEWGRCSEKRGKGVGCSHICAQWTQGEGYGRQGWGGGGSPGQCPFLVCTLQPGSSPFIKAHVQVHTAEAQLPGHLRTFYQRVCWWTNTSGKEWAIQRKQKKTGTKNENSW